MSSVDYTPMSSNYSSFEIEQMAPPQSSLRGKIYGLFHSCSSGLRTAANKVSSATRETVKFFNDRKPVINLSGRMAFGGSGALYALLGSVTVSAGFVKGDFQVMGLAALTVAVGIAQFKIVNGLEGLSFRGVDDPLKIVGASIGAVGGIGISNFVGNLIGEQTHGWAKMGSWAVIVSASGVASFIGGCAVAIIALPLVEGVGAIYGRIEESCCPSFEELEVPLQNELPGEVQFSVPS